MNRSAWDRAKSLLADAAALPAADRERFVVEHCPDPVLRREVLELLAAPAPLTGIVSGGALAPGARLGPYVVDGLIGRGGMGEDDRDFARWSEPTPAPRSLKRARRRPSWRDSTWSFPTRILHS